MPAFQVRVPHPLGKQGAIDKMKRVLSAKLAERKEQVNQMEGTWNDNVLSFALKTYGISITGTMTVEEDAVQIDGSLPFAMMAFKGKVEQTFAGELEKMLGVSSGG